MSDKRAAIIELHRVGKTNSAIVKLLKLLDQLFATRLAGLKNFKVQKIVLEGEDHDLLARQR